jgi:hypothetical protein
MYVCMYVSSILHVSNIYYLCAYVCLSVCLYARTCCLYFFTCACVNICTYVGEAFFQDINNNFVSYLPNFFVSFFCQDWMDWGGKVCFYKNIFFPLKWLKLLLMSSSYWHERNILMFSFFVTSLFLLFFCLLFVFVAVWLSYFQFTYVPMYKVRPKLVML